MHLLAVFSLRNRALIALVTIVIGIFGGIALTSLRQELIPSVTFPQLVVITNYPGASPEVVNEDVSTPIETALQGVQGLEDTVATSSANLSSVSASFQFGTDLTTTEQRVQLAINRIESQLPDDVDPQVITGSIEDLPVLQIAVTSDLDQRDLSTELERTVTDLQQLEGVREASLLGTTGQRVTITPDLDALAAAGLSTTSIRDALDANGVLLPAGEITENDSTLIVQAGERLRAVEDIAALPLLGTADTQAPATGPPAADAPPAAAPVVTIDDVADVALVDDPAVGISRVNGEPALTLAITKTPDANTVAVSQLINEELPALAEAIGEGTEFTVVFDQAPFIEESIESLATEGLLGLAMAVLVILVFLLSIRSTLVTAISIPASVLITFIGMLAFGYTLNIITLGALTIAIGRVVDDSIVVIENIKRHLARGGEKRASILTAVREVAGAVTASTVTTVAVFLPLALVGDITGELFRPFALTVTLALAASLFVSLTIVPVLAYWFLGSRVHKHADSPEAADAEHELDKPTALQRGYLPILRFTLARPVLTLLGAVLVLALTVPAAATLKTNFLGDSGQNTVTVRQSLPNGASLEFRDEQATIVEDVLRDIEGVDIVQASIGSSGSSVRSAFFGGGDTTFSITTDPDVDQVELQDRIRQELEEIDAGDLTLSAAGGGFASSDIEVQITGNDQGDVADAAEAVVDAVQDLDVVADATSDLADTQPFLAIVVDRAAAAERGLSEVAVGGIVTEAMNPSATGSVVLDETTLSIYIDNPTAPQTLEELRAFSIPTALGPVPLTDLASVEEVNGPASITTIQGLRSATVTVTPGSDDVGLASTEVQQAVDGLDLPNGATAELGGVTADQADAFTQLGLALLVAILIVYVVMVATFRSLIQPLLLLVSVPFAATGAVFLQAASGIPLGVSSLIGVLMLIGIVVTNAIVLVDLVNQYRERGMSLREALLHGAGRRLRPILMTALATVFALIPLAIGITGSGGFISQPLAIIVIGGLLSSTVLTLIVLPALYFVVEGLLERWRSRRARRRGARVAAKA